MLPVTRFRFDSSSPARRRLVAYGLVALLSLTAASLAGATNYAWNNAGGGAWSDAASWSPPGVPGAGDVASLGSLGGPYTVTLDLDPAADRIDIAGGPTLDLAGHSLDAVGQLYNAGRLVNLAGTYDNDRFHNLAGGWIEVADLATLTVHDVVQNDGTIALGAALGGTLWLTDSTFFQGTGTLLLGRHAVVNCPLERPQWRIALLNASGHTLSGAGDVWVPVVNHGQLLQDHAQGDLLVLHTYVSNFGTIRVTNGGAINVDCPLVKSYGGTIAGHDGAFTVVLPFDVGGTLDNLGGGTFLAEGGDLRISLGTIVGGVVRQSGGAGSVVVTSYATPQNLVVAAGGQLRIDGFVDLTVEGSSLENHGLVTLRGVLNVDPRPNFPAVSFLGDGTVFLDGGTLATPPGGILVNGPGHTIAGCGTLTANIDNQGTIALDCSGGTPAMVTSGRIVNRNRIELRRGNAWFSGNTIVNQGRLTALAGDLKFQNGAVLDNRAGTFSTQNATVWFGARGAAATIQGGSLVAQGTGEFRTAGPVNLQDVTLAEGARYTTQVHGATHAGGASFTNRGMNRVEAGGTFVLDPATAYTQSGGSTVLAGGSLTAPLGFTVDGRLSGAGTVVGDVVNRGIVAPDASAAGLRIQGAFTQTAAGRLDIGLAAPNLAGHLDVSGPANLAGAAMVHSTDGSVPAAGTVLPVMAFASRTGTFATLAADPGLNVNPVYGDAALTLHTTAVVGVGDLGLPKAVRLYARGTAFVLELPAAATARVRVYDVAGRVVATLLEGASPAGVRAFDLRNLGGSLGRGIYFARATVESAGGVTARTARLAYLF